MDYLNDPSHTYPNRLYLFEFNPSITIIPSTYKVPPSLYNNNNNNNDRPVYMASYLLSHYNNCVHHSYKVLYNSSNMNDISNQHKDQTEHLGIALLRSDLSIINETIINLSRGGSCTGRNKIFPYYQDYRLFTIHGQILLSSQTFLAPIRLAPPSGDDDQDEDSYCPFDYIGTNEAVTNNKDTRYGFTVWVRRYAFGILHRTKKQGGDEACQQ
jgi:hypothetical protein